jgi:hypothetical protein
MVFGGTYNRDVVNITSPPGDHAAFVLSAEIFHFQRRMGIIKEAGVEFMACSPYYLTFNFPAS